MLLYFNMVLAVVTFVQLLFSCCFPSSKLKESGLDQLFVYNFHGCHNIPDIALPSFRRTLQNGINPKPKLIWQRIASDIGTTELIITETDIAGILKGLDIIL